MTRTKRFIAGVGFGYLNQGLIILAGFWLTPFLLRRLGAHDYGVWLVGTQVLTYLMLMDLGVIGLLPRSTAYATGRAGGVAQATDLPMIIGQTARMVLWQTLLIALGAAVLWQTSTREWASLRWPLGMVMLGYVLMFPLRIFQSVLQGLQDLAFLGRVQIFNWLVSTVAGMTLVLAGKGLYALAIGWILSQASVNLICGYRLYRYFPTVLPSSLPSISRDYARQHLTQGFWISVTQIGQVMLTGTELIIIGKLIGPAAVVVYACTNKLIGVLANQPQLVMQAASPALSELRVSESGQRVFQVWSTLSLAMLILSGLVVFIVLTVNEGFVNWWIGNSQFGGYGLTILLLLTMMLRHWNLTWIYALICFGRERLVSIVNITDGLVTISGTVGLVSAIGLKGAPLASILGVCLISQPCYFKALIAETKVSPLTLLGLIWPWLRRFIGLIIAGALLRRYWVPKTFAEIAVAGIATALVYAIVMLPVVLRSDLGRYVRPKLEVMRSRAVRIRQSFGAA